MKSMLMIAALSLSGSYAMAEQYPQPNLLVEPDQLAKPEFASKCVILDARSRSKYEQAHIPGARWVDHAAWAKAFDDSFDAGAWSKKIASLGIERDSVVVVYDDDWNKEAARIWWILKYWGVDDACLLNGGWKDWMAHSLPTQSGTAPAAAATKFVAQPRAARLATKQQLLDSLKDKNLQIVDARSEGEFCGTEAANNKRAGAIPGAKHLEWIDLLDKDSQRFKTPAEIGKLFADAGIDLNAKTATHCQSGGRASVMAFGMELMGAKDVANYYKSWKEWGNADDTPIVRHEPKK